MGLVSQEPVLFDISIWDNIAYGLEGKVDHEQVVTAANLANIHDFILTLPNVSCTINLVSHIWALGGVLIPNRKEEEPKESDSGAGGDLELRENEWKGVPLTQNVGDAHEQLLAI